MLGFYVHPGHINDDDGCLVEYFCVCDVVVTQVACNFRGREHQTFFILLMNQMLAS